MQAEEFDELAFFRAIAQSGARCVLIGRRAVILRGIPVSTTDYDFWLHIDDIGIFNGALAPLEFTPSRTPEAARAVERYVLENSERVDVLIARSVPTVDGVQVSFDQVWERRELVEIGGAVSLAVPCLEDMIATKKFGTRSRDLDDIKMLELLREKGP
jgi:hypothetical protein